MVVDNVLPAGLTRVAAALAGALSADLLTKDWAGRDRCCLQRKAVGGGNCCPSLDLWVGELKNQNQLYCHCPRCCQIVIPGSTESASCFRFGWAKCRARRATWHDSQEEEFSSGI